MSSRILISLAVAAALAAPVAAQADAYPGQPKGDWLFRVGFSQINPKHDNAHVSGLGTIAVDSDISPTFNVTYMLTDHIGTELLAAWPFTHGVDLRPDAGGKVRIATVDVLPPTLSLQWHFNPNGTFRPYIGAGFNYTMFSGEETRGPLSGNKISLEDSWGAAGDVGIDIGASENWFLNLDVRYIDIGSDVNLDGVRLEKVNIDPMAMTTEPTYVNKPVHLTYYPIAVKRAEIKENRKHDEAEGRAVEDYHKQEAATTLMTAAVNGCTQAANTMWSPDGANLDGMAPAQLQYKIKNNAIWKTPMRAFTAPWPDPMIFKGIESVIQQNAMETNQVAWAVNNRKDSRKTATEIEAAQQQQGMLTGTSALVFSIFLRDVLTMTWPIVQSAAKKGTIKFLIEVSDPVEKEAILSKQYEVKPAGDIDFVEKQQRIANIQQDLPLFQGQPIGQEMLKEYIRLRYPEKYDAWSKVLTQGNDAQLIQGLAQALQATVTDEATGQLKPEFQPEAQSLQQLQQAVEQRLAQSPNATQQG